VKGTDTNRQSVGSITADEPLMTTRELMGLLRLSRVGVWRITNRKGSQFPKAIVLGERQKRWAKREVEAWLNSRPRSAT
jgi:predicted DNA-binding transcriptional regulator AlpA